MLRIFEISSKCILGCGLALAMLMIATNATAKDKETVLYSFQGVPDGRTPAASLIMDGSGNLYGTTQVGGNNDTGCAFTSNCGTVFQLAPDGTETVLYAFCSVQNCADGSEPSGGLIMDSSGNLYGVTGYGGGEIGGCTGFGCGVVFKLAPSKKGKKWTETVLYYFTGASDGAGPTGSLIMDASGNLYGTTTGGGTGTNDNGGVVFEVAPDGIETVLYNFCSRSGCSDGGDPNGSLIMDKKGNLYGMTVGGGNDGNGCGTSGCGTAFRLAPDGKETVLYSFCIQANCSDGWAPFAGLIEYKGNFYGTTYYGGKADAGIVFELAPDGTETVLWSFNGTTNGAYPVVGLIENKGNFYSTTSSGGEFNGGTVFELTPKGNETVLYSFCSKTNCTDGVAPYAGLFSVSGNLYGTTTAGGESTNCNGGCGTVFEITKK